MAFWPIWAFRRTSSIPPKVVFLPVSMVRWICAWIQDAPLSAKEILHTYAEEELHKIFGMYGEVKNARTLAQNIVMARNGQEIDTIGDFKKAIAGCMPKGKENKYLAQVFQALRMEVNDELKALEEMLTANGRSIKTGRKISGYFLSFPGRPAGEKLHPER